LSDELVNFLFVALSFSSSLSTTMQLIGDVHVSVLKTFYPPSDTAGTHADISIHTTKLLVDDSCRVSLFQKKFNDSTMTKRHVGDSNFLAVHDGNNQGSIPGKDNKGIFFRHRVQTPRPTQPPIQCILRVSFPWVRRQGREADHWPPPSAGVKDEWN
jgi:hypothetical protein